MTRGGLAALLATALAAAPAAAGSAPPAASPSAEALHLYLQRLALYGFSGGVVVALDGEPLFARGYGLSNRDTGVPYSARTPTYVASLSKMFVAAAILRLSERRALRLDDPISAYLPGVPADKSRITIRMLLTHRSGLSGDDADTEGLGRDAFVARVLSAPLAADPGTAFEYSNDGYGVAAAIVEIVSRRELAGFLHAEIFGPAGMTDSRLVTEPTRAAAVIAYRAETPMGDASMSHRRPYGWSEVAGAGVITSARDLYRWHLALEHGRVLSHDSVATMRPAAAAYGLGLNAGLTGRATLRVGHGGLEFPEGWNASYRELPEDEAFIAVVSNAYAGVSLGEFAANGIDALALGGELAMPPPTRVCRRSEARGTAGTYRTSSGAELAISLGPGNVVLLAPRNQLAQNILTFGDEAARPDLDRANLLVLNQVDALADGAGDAGVGRVAPGQRARLSGLYRRLVEQFGALTGREAISVLASDGPAIETFVRLHFARGEAVVRAVVLQDRITATSGLDSYGPRAFELERRLGRIRLTCPDYGRLLAFDFVEKRPLVFRISRGPGGTVDAIRLPGGSSPARRVEG